MSPTNTTLVDCSTSVSPADLAQAITLMDHNITREANLPVQPVEEESEEYMEVDELSWIERFRGLSRKLTSSRLAEGTKLKGYTGIADPADTIPPEIVSAILLGNDAVVAASDGWWRPPKQTAEAGSNGKRPIPTPAWFHWLNATEAYLSRLIRAMKLVLQAQDRDAGCTGVSRPPGSKNGCAAVQPKRPPLQLTITSYLDSNPSTQLGHPKNGASGCSVGDHNYVGANRVVLEKRVADDIFCRSKCKSMSTDVLTLPFQQCSQPNVESSQYGIHDVNSLLQPIPAPNGAWVPSVASGAVEDQHLLMCRSTLEDNTTPTPSHLPPNHTSAIMRQ